MNKELVEEMHDEGMTYQKIGDELGITRQRIHQLLKGYVSPSARIPEKQRRQHWLYLIETAENNIKYLKSRITKYKNKLKYIK